LKFTINSDDLLTIPEAAKELNKGVATIYRWMKSGKLQTIKLSRNTLIPRTEILRLKQLEDTTTGNPTSERTGEPPKESDG